MGKGRDVGQQDRSGRSVIDWDRYFMEIAKVVALRSKDPNTQVGAVIVTADNHIVSTGYNGFPPGINESGRWDREGKHKFVLHAEVNAICHAPTRLQGHTVYTTLFPCLNCAKTIASSGIAKLVYQRLRPEDADNTNSWALMEESGIEISRVQLNSPI